ncbi:MAG: adenylate/guanylate cyclase domain-containing protein [Ignavibacteriales bacterium]|nr:adenylate/guanylate cyclase domain-containing protein [Ignavibacteriales bacterium]
MVSVRFKKKILPRLIQLAIGLGIGIVVLALTQEWLFEVNFLRNIDLMTIDLRYQSRYDRIENQDVHKQEFQRRSGVVIVGISDDDLKALPREFPFPRSYYAHVIENLNKAGAKAVVFDMTFEAPREGDTAMSSVLQQYDNVVLAAKASTGSENERADIRTLDEKFNNVFFDDARRQIGISNILKDRDDVCRKYIPLFLIRGNTAPSLAFGAMNRAFNLKPLTIPGLSDPDYFIYRDRKIPRYEPQTFMVNYYGPDKTFRYMPFSQVIDDSSFQTKDELEVGEQINAFDETLTRLVKGKIVLIGSVMPEERDYHNTPLFKDDNGKKNYAMNGVEIHATVIQNLIDNNFIGRMDPAAEIAIVIVVAMTAFMGLLVLKQAKFRHAWLVEIGVFLLMIALIFGVFEFALFEFSSNNTLVSIVNPSLAIVLAYLSAAVYQYLIERQQKALIKGVFGHYLSPVVVNMLANDPDKAKLGGDRRELSVFFSDIANFTTVSEAFKQPEGLVELLNEYLEEMTSVILKHEGTLDKYVGDAIIAFWNAPLPQKDHAYRSCVAALDMQKRLEVLRPKWKKEGRPELGARMGVNTGVMIVGNIGGKDRFDYTVIGDSVNLASRLEGANKQYHSNIMMSEFTYNHVKGKVVVRELDLIQVKGKTEPVRVYELLGLSDMKLTDNQKQSLELYHEGLKLYRERKWEEAIAYLQQAYAQDETCYAAQLYTERANLYQITPPPADWNGVFVMKTK